MMKFTCLKLVMKLIVAHCIDYLYSKAGRKFHPNQIYSFEATVARNWLFFHTAKRACHKIAFV